MANMLPTPDKIEKVKAYLLENKRATVAELKMILPVSEVTIRKILTHLGLQGFAIRSYGGAVLAESPAALRSVESRCNVASSEKKAIARVCSNMVEDWENVILDAGSTTLAIARMLRNRKVRVITNSLPIAEELCDSNAAATVEMLGGTLRKNSASVIGPQACRTLEKLRADKAFIGCSGFDPAIGFSCENSIEAETKKAMLDCAAKKIIVCDHSKFGRPAFANFADPEDVDMVVSDRRAGEEALRFFRKSNVRMIVAK